MKQTIITLLFAITTMGIAAQDADSTCIKSDTLRNNLWGCGFEQQPTFPGGQEALLRYLKKNLKYPQLAEDYGVEGRVIMSFVVEKDGTLTKISANNCKIIRFNTTKFSQETEATQKHLKEQFALLFAKEGARAIRKMPKWTPGRRNGKNVRVKFSLPITFYDPNK